MSSNELSVSIHDDHVFLIPYSNFMVYYINWLEDTNPILHSWDTTHLSLCNITLYVAGLTY